MHTDPQSWNQRQVYIDKQSWDQRHMTVCRKACSQNRPNNAFPCVTPLLVNKKHTCLTIIKSTNKTTKASIFLQQRTCADFFSFSQTNPKTRLNYCYGTWHRSLLSFAFPSLQCVVGLFSSVVWTNSSGIVRAFFPRKWSSVLGSPSLLHPNAFFCLRGACAQLAREMELNFSVLELLDWHILKPLLLENKQHIQRKALMIKSMYIQCMRVYIF